MRRSRLIVLLALLVASLGVVVQDPALAARGRKVTLIDYGSDQWTYRQVAHGRLRHFQDGEYTDNHFREGQAGFGTTDGTCPVNNARRVRTPWQPDTDMLLRQTFYLPEEEYPVFVGNLHLTGTVDDSVDVYLDGDLVGHVDATPCEHTAIDLDLGYGDYGFNVLALRASDHGGATYVDVKLTGVEYDED